VFGGDRGSKLHPMHLAQIIHETHRNVDFCGQLLKQAQTRPAVVPDTTQTTKNARNLQQCLSICADGNSAKWLRV